MLQLLAFRNFEPELQKQLLELENERLNTYAINTENPNIKVIPKIPSHHINQQNKLGKPLTWTPKQLELIAIEWINENINKIISVQIPKADINGNVVTMEKPMPLTINGFCLFAGISFSLFQKFDNAITDDEYNDLLLSNTININNYNEPDTNNDIVDLNNVKRDKENKWLHHHFKAYKSIVMCVKQYCVASVEDRLHLGIIDPKVGIFSLINYAGMTNENTKTESNVTHRFELPDWDIRSSKGLTAGKE